MSETDKTYNWIRNVIMSCKNIAHIELCGVLIAFYEKKGPESYLIKNLNESLNLKKIMIKETAKQEKEDASMSPIIELFTSGEYTVKEISEKLNIKLNICEKIVKEYMIKKTMF